jgi:hypothetical protein
MSTIRRSAADDRDASRTVYGAANANGRGGAEHTGLAEGRHPGGPRGPRKKRHRHRLQGGKQPRPMQSRGPQTEVRNRERIFQDIEGLLRQIREQAEESAVWTEEELRAITVAVTSFTRSLEDEADPVSERVRSEYQRVRERLSQALKGERTGV